MEGGGGLDDVVLLVYPLDLFIIYFESTCSSIPTTIIDLFNYYLICELCQLLQLFTKSQFKKRTLYY